MEEAAKFVGVDAVTAFVLGPLRSFLKYSCFPESVSVARAAMWCLVMLCNMVCAKCYFAAP